MIYLSLDLGLTHIGVAISHEGTLAQTLPSFDIADSSQLLIKVSSLIAEHKPEVILLGLPPAGPIVTLANSLKSELEASNPSLPVILHEEHKSSSQAQVLLKSAGASLQKRKRLDHSAAAAYILQDYLDNFA